MAAPFKDRFDVDLVRRLAALLKAGVPGFDEHDFVAAATSDFADLELSQRARAVAAALPAQLPPDPATAIDLIRTSLPDSVAAQRWQSFDSFMLWPLTMYVAEHGQSCFEESMAAQHALTQLFTAEFSIRSFLQQQPQRTLAQLADWTTDPSEHVRRLVSEGTRPRLPWAAQLPAFIADPSPILPLLEPLRDDPSEYVRRSVANNLNDIAKDHPDVARAVTARWLAEDPSRRPLVRHALRTLVKAGDPAALRILGYDGRSPIGVTRMTIQPTSPRIGDRLTVVLELSNPSPSPAAARVDLVVGFARPSGNPRRKVFVGAELELPPGERRTLRRSVSLAQLSTRAVHPGTHTVAIMINGVEGPPSQVQVAS